MKILFVPVGKPPEVREIDGSLKSMQELVGGYLEPVKLHDGVLALVDEDGRMKRLPMNRMFVGPFFLARSEPPEFVSLTDSDIEHYSEVLAEDGQ